MSWPQQALQNRGLGNAVARVGTVGSRLGPTPGRIMICLNQFLQTTQEYGCTPTLAITARVLSRHAELGRSLVDQGAEMAIHGYVHTDYGRLPYASQFEHLRRARELFSRHDIPHQGFRAPYLSWNADTLKAAAKVGLSYDSSWLVDWETIDQKMAEERGWNWQAYQHLLELHRPQSAMEVPSLPVWTNGIVQIPASYPDDESLIDWLGIRKPEDITEIWLAALGKACKREELFTLQLHHERVPLCRSALEAVLAQARTGRYPVWMATLGEIAGWWKERQGFRWQRTRGEAGQYCARLAGSPRAVILIKGVPWASTPAGPWIGGWRRVKGQEICVPAGKRPVVGVPDRAPKSLIAFLEQEGYIIEVGRRPRQAIYLEGLSRYRLQDARRLLSMLDACPGPLVRVARWPAGARAALAVTGDIDAITWWDFAWRLAEC